eukprot:scaffold2987_cov170-Amphora_coffeaeformis.AAC.12
MESRVVPPKFVKGARGGGGGPTACHLTAPGVGKSLQRTQRRLGTLNDTNMTCVGIGGQCCIGKS